MYENWKYKIHTNNVIIIKEIKNLRNKSHKIQKNRDFLIFVN